MAAVSQNSPAPLDHPDPAETLKPGAQPTDRAWGTLSAMWRLGARRRSGAVSRPRRALGRRDLHARRAWVDHLRQRDRRAARRARPYATLVGRNALDLVHPDDRTRAIEALHRSLAAAPGAAGAVLRAGPARRRALAPGGARRQQPQRTTSTSAAHVITMRDIADRDRVDRLLAETEANYRRIVETAEEGVWTFDARITTTFVNRRMAEMLGYNARTRWSGAPCSSSWTTTRRGRGQSDPGGGSRRTRSPSATSSGSSIATGHDVWTRCSASPIFGIDGALRGRRLARHRHHRAT